MARYLKQASFATGEIAPELYGRTDIPRYAAALKTCRNFFVTPGGQAKNRPGTVYVNDVKDHTKPVRLIPFVFSSTQSYVLELGEYYMRVHTIGTVVGGKGSEYEMETPWVESQLQRLKFAQQNDVMVIVHPSTPPQVLRRFADDNWTLKPFNVARPVSPPTSVALSGSWGAQVDIDTHPLQDWDWVVTSEDAGGMESLPSAALELTDCVLYTDRLKPKFTWSAPGAGNAPVRYHVYRGRRGVYGYVGSTTITLFTDDGHVPDYSDAPPLEADPLRIESRPADGDQASVDFAGANTFVIKTQAAEAFNDKYTFRYHLLVESGEHVVLAFKSRPDSGSGWTTHETLTFGTIWVGEEYDVDMLETIEVDGQVADSEFEIEVTDSAGSPVVTRQSVIWTVAPTTLKKQHTYPAAVCFYEQRLVLAGMSHSPQSFRASQTGDYWNFDESHSVKDDDALDLTLASLRLDEIRSVVPLEGLLMFTSGAEWVVRGAGGGPLTPSSFDLKPRTYYGSSWVDPLVVGNAVLFVAERARTVREFRHDPSGAAVTEARELSILARHLLKDSGVREWAYAEVPHNVAFAVRNDGALLGLTYVREHDVWGWHRHDTDGLFEAVACVPEGDETGVYVVVNRTIDGSTKRYIERFASREVSGVAEAIHVDSALSYDGANSTATTIKAKFGTNWAGGVTLTLQASSAIFDSGDVGTQFELTGADLVDADGNTYNETCRFTVTGYTDTTNLRARAETVVPATVRNITTSTWSQGHNTFAGLGHLEGKMVAVLADGNYAGVATVNSGSIALQQFGYRVHVGLSFTSDLVSLPLQMPKDTGRSRMAHKAIAEVGLELDEWRGLKAGESLDELATVQRRKLSAGDAAINPENALVVVRPKTAWGRTVSVALRQSEPLPVTVLSIIAEVAGDD